MEHEMLLMNVTKRKARLQEMIVDLDWLELINGTSFITLKNVDRRRTLNYVIPCITLLI